jgi:hypothetical protein
LTTSLPVLVVLWHNARTDLGELPVLADPVAEVVPVPAPVTFAAGTTDRAAIDGLIFAVFDNVALRRSVRSLEKLELSSVWRLTHRLLQSRAANDRVVPVAPYAVHRRMIEGLAGETLIVSSAMFLNSFAEAEDFFGLTFKTIKSRLGTSLAPGESEMAMRGARATVTAAQVLGDYDAARAYMHTRNFALGGATPAELVKTSEGEQIVLNELQTQADGGPL